jgi:hypothetical protein
VGKHGGGMRIASGSPVDTASAAATDGGLRYPRPVSTRRIHAACGEPSPSWSALTPAPRTPARDYAEPCAEQVAKPTPAARKAKRRTLPRISDTRRRAQWRSFRGKLICSLLKDAQNHACKSVCSALLPREPVVHGPSLTLCSCDGPLWYRCFMYAELGPSAVE